MTEQWEVRWVEARDTGGDPTLPAGWEPFAAVSGGLWLRRRVVPAVTRPVPSGVLSARERQDRRLADYEWARMREPTR